jgi:hypothetical protein
MVQTRYLHADGSRMEARAHRPTDRRVYCVSAYWGDNTLIMFLQAATSVQALSFTGDLRRHCSDGGERLLGLSPPAGRCMATASRRSVGRGCMHDVSGSDAYAR